VALHRELNEEIPSDIAIAGPYWGLNLVLWARGLIRFPVIGIGSGYQFFMSGGHTQYPTPRIAIPSLKRLMEAASVQPWLDQAIAALPSSHPASDEFKTIRKQFPALKDASLARAQVAKFYKEWYESISAIAKSDRAEFLYNDFNSAYILGKKLPDMPDSPRRPEAVAEMLMSCCL
jgi:hypothetical protein